MNILRRYGWNASNMYSLMPSQGRAHANTHTHSNCASTTSFMNAHTCRHKTHIHALTRIYTKSYAFSLSHSHTHTHTHNNIHNLINLKVKEQLQGENIGLQAKVKRAEAEARRLQLCVDARTAENAELIAICDQLLQKLAPNESWSKKIPTEHTPLKVQQCRKWTKEKCFPFARILQPTIHSEQFLCNLLAKLNHSNFMQRSYFEFAEF